LISKVDARYLIALGFLITSIGLFHLSRLNLDIAFNQAVWARVLQASGLAFLFIPIQTVAYIGMPREKSNAISGMTNLSRNIGGSVGISLVTTLLARRAQYHQAVLSAHATGSNSAFRKMISGTTALRRNWPRNRLTALLPIPSAGKPLCRAIWMSTSFWALAQPSWCRASSL